MFPDRLFNLALLVSDELRERRLKLVTAESCTGGLVAGLFTEISGSSAFMERGYVTYSNKAKEEVLGIPGDVIADYGAVSEPVARMMAEGALEQSRANIAISITGIAGPGGGTPMKPVGTVHFACLRENRAVVHQVQQYGDIGRRDVRLASVETALEMIREQIA
ncbi:MAG: CinA family protein [Pseudomonadota bacterium]